MREEMWKKSSSGWEGSVISRERREQNANYSASEDEEGSVWKLGGRIGIDVAWRALSLLSRAPIVDKRAAVAMSRSSSRAQRH